MLATFIPLFIAVSAAMMGMGIISPIMPLYIRSFGAGGMAVGAVFAAFSVSRLLLGPVAGVLSDRVGRKRLIVWGLGAYAAVSVLYVVAQNLWQLGLFRLLHGVGSILVTPIAQAYVGDITPVGWEGRITNIFYASMFAGMALGPLLGGYLVEGVSLEAPFYAMGILSLLALIGVAKWVPDDRKAPRGGVLRAAPNLRAALRSPAVMGMIVYFATRGLWRQSFNSFWPLLAASHGHSEAAIGLVLTGYLVGEGLFQIPFGYLADRFPRLPQIAIGALLSPLPMFFVPWVRNLWAVVVLSAAMGVGSALGRASVLAIRTEAGRSHGMGTLAGVQNSAFAAGQMLGPIVAGTAFDLFGLAAPMYLGAVLGVAGGALAVFLFSRELTHRWPSAAGRPEGTQPRRFRNR